METSLIDLKLDKNDQILGIKLPIKYPDILDPKLQDEQCLEIAHVNQLYLNWTHQGFS